MSILKTIKMLNWDEMPRLNILIDAMVLLLLVIQDGLIIRTFMVLCLWSILYTKSASAYWIGRRHVHEERARERGLWN